MEKEKWIEDAFKNAAQPKVDGMSVSEFSDMITEKFKEDFPHTMTSFQYTYGDGVALKIAGMMMTNTVVFTLCRCFYLSGYCRKMKETEKGGQEDA